MSRSSRSDDSQRNLIRDTVADFEAQANQTIVSKYRSLKWYKQQMTKMKRNFNEKLLALQEEKQKKCALLCEKIAKFRQNYKKLYPNENDIDVETFSENTLYFDGKSFKVHTIFSKYLIC